MMVIKHWHGRPKLAVDVPFKVRLDRALSYLIDLKVSLLIGLDDL